MNESERRRKQLLEEARSLYSDKHDPPAIHPRYQSFYTKLYGKEEGEEDETSTFAIRGFICILLFCVFVVADYKGADFAKVDSKKVVQEIEYQIDLKKIL